MGGVPSFFLFFFYLSDIPLFLYASYRYKLLLETEIVLLLKTKTQKMKIDKQMLKCLFASWLRHDAELWGELRQIQIKLLYDRIVDEKTYLEIANEHDTTIKQIRVIIKTIFIKIKESHGEQMGKLLETINTYLEDVEIGIKKPNDPIKPICLN